MLENTLFVIGSLLFFVFPFIIFPVWMGGDCLKREEWTPRFRRGWIGAMLLAWPMAGYLYALIAARRASHKLMALVMIAYFLVGYGEALSLQFQQRKEALTSLLWLERRVQQSPSQVLSKQEKHQTLAALGDLRREIGSHSALSRKLREDLALFYSLNSYMFGERKTSRFVVRDWLERFEKRHYSPPYLPRGLLELVSLLVFPWGRAWQVTLFYLAYLLAMLFNLYRLKANAFN